MNKIAFKKIGFPVKRVKGKYVPDKSRKQFKFTYILGYAGIGLQLNDATKKTFQSGVYRNKDGEILKYP